jgi:integrase-like protein/restriction endonuclease
MTKGSAAKTTSHPRRDTTKQLGDSFEKRVFDYFTAEIAADRFWARKSNCRVFAKKGYHSKDRNSKIVFDIAIELYLPRAKEYSSLVLIECKNYQHSVPVDDAEEFFAKVQQVGAANTKAVVASSASFQTGTREFAKSKGIGLLRYFDHRDFKWELKRSPSASARSTSADNSYLVEQGLSQPDFRSYLFDLYLQSPIRETNSLWDFVEDLVLDSGLTPEQIAMISNARSKLSNQVPFLEKDELESKSSEVLAGIGYSGDEVSLEALCAREAHETGLVVRTDVAPVTGDSWPVALGRITFAPLVIETFATESFNRARERFTLAHELAHHLLAHGRYMIREYCDENDFVLHRRSLLNGSDMLAIGAFAGLREAEIQRLHWNEIDLARGHIEVTAAKAKSARRRIVPMQPNLTAWLRPYSGMTGNVVPLNARAKLERARKVAGLVKWPQNGLRHSFASYRLASIHDAPRVSAELGHASPHMLYSTYRELVHPEEAERYWKIEPAAAANVVRTTPAQFGPVFGAP